jgi:hypothetical protein
VQQLSNVWQRIFLDERGNNAHRIFSLNTPIKTIAADRGDKAVLDRDVPGLMASRSYM